MIPFNGSLVPRAEDSICPVADRVGAEQEGMCMPPSPVYPPMRKDLAAELK